MAKNGLSKFQQGVVSRYYEHKDTIMLQRIQEMVTDLYLAETEAKRKRLWDRVHKAMVNLKVKPAIINHIMAKKDVQILAKNLQDWLKIGKKS